MIIDFHTHVFPDKIASSTISALSNNSGTKPNTDGTVDGMIKALERANADIAIALPVLTKASQFDSVTKFAIEVNGRFLGASRKIISFGGMHPDCENVDEKIKYLKESGILGIKIHPDYQQTFIDDERYVNIIKCAKKYDMVVVTHSGVDDGYRDQPVRCAPDRILNLLSKVPYDKIVLGHFGAHRLWEETLKKLAGLNLYFDTAFTFNDIKKDLFVKIIEKHGAEKVLFATDCPWRDIKDDYNIFKSYGLNSDVEDKILYKNALKLLGI
jgi:predicted TIM-barrel fold metal-dependent hydrolase